MNTIKDWLFDTVKFSNPIFPLNPDRKLWFFKVSKDIQCVIDLFYRKSLDFSSKNQTEMRT